MPPLRFLPHHLSQTRQLQGCFLARPRQCFQPLPCSSLFQSLLKWLPCLQDTFAWHQPALHGSDIDAKLILMACKGSMSPFYMLPNSHQLPSPFWGSWTCCPLDADEGLGEQEDSHHTPHLKNCICPARMVACGCWIWTLCVNIEEEKGTGWLTSWINRPWGHSCILLCLFLVTAPCPHPGKHPVERYFLPIFFVTVLETRSAGLRAGRGEEGTRAVPTRPTTACSQQKILSPARSYH